MYYYDQDQGDYGQGEYDDEEYDSDQNLQGLYVDGLDDRMWNDND